MRKDRSLPAKGEHTNPMPIYIKRHVHMTLPPIHTTRSRYTSYCPKHWHIHGNIPSCTHLFGYPKRSHLRIEWMPQVHGQVHRACSGKRNTFKVLHINTTTTTTTTGCKKKENDNEQRPDIQKHPQLKLKNTSKLSHCHQPKKTSAGPKANRATTPTTSWPRCCPCHHHEVPSHVLLRPRHKCGSLSHQYLGRGKALRSHDGFPMEKWYQYLGPTFLLVAFWWYTSR